ncbi:uncharacterized protein LOC119393742 [Rhipicephalus sanguineus]|nr:uncharacterized protein LOC119393742 [Rhipicephalus sanguineus]
MKILVELKSMRTLLTANKSTRVLVLPEDCPTIPASTVADVQAIEEYLSSQEHMELLTNYCSRFGGTDFQDTVRILLRNLMTKAASLQFSWKGSRGRKNAFAELKNINNMILACLRAHYPEQASLTKCSVVVKRWLIGAQDREGGRNRRRQSSQAGVANTLLEE